MQTFLVGSWSNEYRVVVPSAIIQHICLWKKHFPTTINNKKNKHLLKMYYVWSIARSVFCALSNLSSQAPSEAGTIVPILKMERLRLEDFFFTWFTQLVILQLDLDPGESDSKAHALYHSTSLLAVLLLDKKRRKKKEVVRDILKRGGTILTGCQQEMHFSFFSPTSIGRCFCRISSNCGLWSLSW